MLGFIPPRVHMKETLAFKFMLMLLGAGAYGGDQGQRNKGEGPVTTMAL